jgi:hypothetical protein
MTFRTLLHSGYPIALIALGTFLVDLEFRAGLHPAPPPWGRIYKEIRTGPYPLDIQLTVVGAGVLLFLLGMIILLLRLLRLTAKRK